MNIAAKVLYIDFEGRSDSKSIKELLERIKPRQLVSDYFNLKFKLNLKVKLNFKSNLKLNLNFKSKISGI